jgi:hypothetical protein
MCKTHPTMSNIITISNGIIKNNHAYLGYNSKLDAIVIAWRGTLAV